MQACLLYVEGILICQYVYQIPSRLHCDFIDPVIQVKQCWEGLQLDLIDLLAAARVSMSASLVLCCRLQLNGWACTAVSSVLFPPLQSILGRWCMCTIWEDIR